MWVFYRKEVFPLKGGKDWAVWCCGLIFYLCLRMLGVQSEDSIGCGFLFVRLISSQRISINKGEALAHVSELTPVVLQVSWRCHGIFSPCTKRALKWLRKTCSWPGGTCAQVSGWLLGNLMKRWQNWLGITWRKPWTLFLFSILRLGGRKFILHEATPDVFLSYKRDENYSKGS